MNKKLKKAATIGLTILPFIMATTGVFGTNEEIDLTPSSGFESLAGFSIGSLVRNLITLAMVIASIVAFGFLIFGGIMWITSGGDKSKTEQARNTITAALVGLIIVFGSWAIMQIIEAVFGVSILQLNLQFESVTS